MSKTINETLYKISSVFNFEKVDLYKKQQKIFLNTISTINENDSNCLSDQEEEDYFQALHFIKYKINSLIPDPASMMSRPVDKELNDFKDMLNKIRTRIVNANNGLILKIAGKLGKTKKDNEELYSEGLFALLNATDRYDPWRGYKFSTYACNAIRNQLVGKPSRSDKLNTTTIDETNMNAYLAYQPKEQIFETGILDALEKASLSETENDIISQRFGLNGCHPKTLKELSLEYSKSVEAIRLTEGRAIEKIRQAFKQI